MITYSVFNPFCNHMLSLKSRSELFAELVERCRATRLRQNRTQKEAAERAGIPLSTYRRFEQSGQLSLERFVAVLHALNQVAALEQLLTPPPVNDLDELDAAPPERQRARTRS
jgi:transcriptional regulator with XRE-family HTH domain